MANLSVRYVCVDVKDNGKAVSVSLRPAAAADSPNGTENNSLWPATPAIPVGNELTLRFSSGVSHPFVKTGQIVATFAAG